MSPHSPLTAEQKRHFKGLKYFPENPSLRLELKPEWMPEGDWVQMQTNTGQVQSYERYARVRFEVDGEPAELTIFRNEHGLFLPFADALAGVETYGAGRYYGSGGVARRAPAGGFQLRLQSILRLQRELVLSADTCREPGPSANPGR